MQGLLLRSQGSGDGAAVGSCERPVPGPDEVLVKVRFGSLNRMDLLLREGVIKAQRDLPMVMGLDASGTIAALGNRVAGLATGQAVTIYPLVHCGLCRHCEAGEPSLCAKARFLGLHRAGTLAEFACVPARNVVPLPPEVGFADAACLPSAYLTAWRIVNSKARVRPDDTVVVVGAGGGVAVAALQWAKACGARVIVTSGSESKLEAVRALGADHVVHRGSQDVVKTVLELTGGEGASVVLNSVGGPTWNESLRMAERGARLVTCGVTAGDQPPADLRRVFMRQYHIMGSTLGSLAEFRAMLAFLQRGTVRPVIHRAFPLRDALAAMAELKASRHLGKVLIEMPAD